MKRWCGSFLPTVWKPTAFRWWVVHTKGVEVVSIDNTFFCPTGAELVVEILFATTYHKDLVRAMMVAMNRATE